MPSSAPRSAYVQLFFLADTLKRFLVRFLVHKPSGVGISFHPAISLRVVDLGSVANNPTPMSVADWRILGHLLSSFRNSRNWFQDTTAPIRFSIFFAAYMTVERSSRVRSLPEQPSWGRFVPLGMRQREGELGAPAGRSNAKYDSYRFGSVAYLLGYATLEQIQQALAEQVEDNVSGRVHRLLGTILRAKGWINEEQEQAILTEMKTIGK